MVKKITKENIIGLYLNDYSRRYYLRELASLLGKPHQTIKPHIETLVEEKIIMKNKRKNITEYALNFKNKKIYDCLIIAEKSKLMGQFSEDMLLKVLFEKLSIYFEKNTFVIFGSGSVAKLGSADIDLLVVGKQNMSKNIEDFEKIYHKKIHKIQVSSLAKLTHSLVKEIYKKHIILNNTEQIIRFFGGLYEQNKLV